MCSIDFMCQLLRCNVTGEGGGTAANHCDTICCWARPCFYPHQTRPPCIAVTQKKEPRIIVASRGQRAEPRGCVWALRGPAGGAGHQGVRIRSAQCRVLGLYPLQGQKRRQLPEGPLFLLGTDTAMHTASADPLCHVMRRSGGPTVQPYRCPEPFGRENGGSIREGCRGRRSPCPLMIDGQGVCAHGRGGPVEGGTWEQR